MYLLQVIYLLLDKWVQFLRGSAGNVRKEEYIQPSTQAQEWRTFRESQVDSAIGKIMTKLQTMIEPEAKELGFRFKELKDWINNSLWSTIWMIQNKLTETQKISLWAQSRWMNENFFS